MAEREKGQFSRLLNNSDIKLFMPKEHCETLVTRVVLLQSFIFRKARQ